MHALDEVGGAEEHLFQAFFDHFIADGDPLAEDEGPEVLLELVFSLAPQEHEVVLDESDLHLLPESPDNNVERSTFNVKRVHPGVGISGQICYTGRRSWS